MTLSTDSLEVKNSREFIVVEILEGLFWSAIFVLICFHCIYKLRKIQFSSVISLVLKNVVECFSLKLGEKKLSSANKNYTWFGQHLSP